MTVSRPYQPRHATTPEPLRVLRRLTERDRELHAALDQLLPESERLLDRVRTLEFEQAS